MTYWIWLSKLTGINIRQKLDLIAYYGDAKGVFMAAEKVPFDFPRISQKGIDALARRDLTPAGQIVIDCMDKKVGIVTYADPAYPPLLRSISDPPLVLYTKGKLPDWEKMPGVGMVGTRKASVYGLQNAHRLGMQIASCGGLVISGCADGVDTAAMQGALAAGQMTVGVLGCGIDVVYPSKNRAFFREVEAKGCLISEYEPGLTPMPFRFVARNRLISGMSEALVVVEAAQKSGSLITANDARQQGRLLFAIPGNAADPGCAGSNALLREGAGVALCAADVLKSLTARYPEVDITRMPAPIWEKPASSPARFPVCDTKPIDNREKSRYSGKEINLPELKPDEKLVYEHLTEKGVLVDSLVGIGGMTISRVLVAITGLELNRLAERCPGCKVRLKQQS